MSIWNKILVFLLFIAALVFFHAATRTLKTYVYWSTQSDKFEKKLNEVREDIASLQTGNQDLKNPRVDKTVGVQQLRNDLGRLLANRGRIWSKCEKQTAVIQPSGILEVGISTDESTPFTDKMLVYAFEEGDDQSPGHYLGEYHVKAVSEKKVQLASTTQMSVDPTKKVKFLADHVMESRVPWVLYELMPTDEHEAFTKLPEDQRKWVSDGFAKDGQDFEALTESQKKLSDDGHPDEAGKKLRPLCDYLATFRACEMFQTFYPDRVSATENDLKYLAVAKQAVIEQLAAVEKQKTEVGMEDKRARAELGAVTEHSTNLQRMLTFNQSAVQAAIARNLEYTQKIASMQKAVVDLIDRRTHSMAQYGPGAH